MSTITTSKSRSKEIIIGSSVVVVIAVLVLISTLANKSTSSSSSMADMTVPVKSSSSSSNNTVSSSTKFKDGTYKAVGSYEAPGEKESITVTLSLQGGVVENASVIEGYKSSESQLYQDQFESAYKQLVVGKKITAIGNLSHVAASSLTSQGFDDAVKQIEQQAAEA
jgi:hypothetical protein